MGGDDAQGDISPILPLFGGKGLILSQKMTDEAKRQAELSPSRGRIGRSIQEKPLFSRVLLDVIRLLA